MMLYVPGWRIHRLGVYRWSGFTKGEIFVREIWWGLKDEGWGLEIGKFIPSSPKLARHLATILNT